MTIKHHTVKNVKRIEEIESPLSFSMHIVMSTSAIGRIVKKDWNLICSKMHVFLLNRDLAPKIREGLQDFQWAVADLAENPAVTMFKYEDTSFLTPLPFELRIVSTESAGFLRALRSLDLSVARMLAGERKGHLIKEQRMKCLQPVNFAYNNFKFAAMNQLDLLHVARDSTEEDDRSLIRAS